jgi:hypothetical protein
MEIVFSLDRLSLLDHHHLLATLRLLQQPYRSSFHKMLDAAVSMAPRPRKRLALVHSLEAAAASILTGLYYTTCMFTIEY